MTLTCFAHPAPFPQGYRLQAQGTRSLPCLPPAGVPCLPTHHASGSPSPKLTRPHQFSNASSCLSPAQCISRRMSQAGSPSQGHAGHQPRWFHPGTHAALLVASLPSCPSPGRATTDLGWPGPEGGASAFGPSSGGLVWRLGRGARRWRVSRCPGRHSWPATAPGPGSCPSAAPAAGCSPWAAAGTPAPGGASPSRARGAVCVTHGPPRSQRGGPMTPSCPHPCLPRLLSTPGSCSPSPGGLAS